jgi:hypothetical protein
VDTYGTSRVAKMRPEGDTRGSRLLPAVGEVIVGSVE